MSMFVSANVGGTWTRISLAKENRIVACTRESTILEGSDTAISSQIIRLYTSLCNEIGLSGSAKLGMSFAGLVLEDGRATKGVASNICGGLENDSLLPNDWNHVDFSPLFDVFSDVIIKNDVVAEMLVEHSHGALKGFRNCAYINWGTGVGAGIIVDGHLLRGKQGFAGHAGHQFVSDESKVTCGCGNVGDLESTIGARGVKQRYGASTQELFLRAHNGDPLSIEITNGLVRNLSRGVFNLLAILDLEAVCLGGSVFENNSNNVLNTLYKNLEGYSQLFTNGVTITQAMQSNVASYVSGFTDIAPDESIGLWIENIDKRICGSSRDEKG